MSAKKYKVLLIDDEELVRKSLKHLIQKHCTELDVIGEAEDVFEAKQQIEKSSPNIVFLDINMPKLNGFDLLESLKKRDFALIFATADENQGKKALEFGAIDYLAKPFIIDDLKKAIQKAVKWVDSPANENKTQAPAKPSLLEDENIIITHSKGYLKININEIIRIESLSNYSKIYLIDDRQITTAKTLKSFDDLLKFKQFYRIHKSHLINTNFMLEYRSNSNGMVILKDGSKIKIARNKQADFKRHLSNE